MSHTPRFSVIVPVFNRPHEVEALLTSLLHQTSTDFEVLIIEDGSTETCKAICERFQDQLRIQYHVKSNSGPGPSRNVGFGLARGTYFVVFDSDCQLPPHYFEVVEKSLREQGWDAWGGPDRGHPSFTPIQQAMAYTMSSLLTTGGIRGKKKSVGSFQPRSFNMGIHRSVFEKTGGFQFDRYAEDIEFSIRMRKAGFRVGLIADAFVYHQRRENLYQFWRQVANFGKGRVLVGRKYPGEVRLVHVFPSIFLLAFLTLPLLILGWPTVGTWGVAVFALFVIAVFFDCLRQTRSVVVSLWAVPASFVQLSGYGFGFLSAALRR